ncbi:hypothetical protein [Nocardia lijiangensis]|uniref:hypothetical protein n=1 Tax=Nocardia lijiangensis TaxID=299618 RepID=UPI003D7386DE
MPAASNRLLPDVVAQFRNTHPNVQFRVNECGSMEVEQGVRTVLAIPEKHPLARANHRRRGSQRLENPRVRG